MKRNFACIVLVLVIASLSLTGCAVNSLAAAEESVPLKIERLDGNVPTRETLSAEAAKRLDIQTAGVSQTQVNGMPRLAVPYGAILYDTVGATWVYTNPQPLTFERYPVVVDDVQGDQAILSEGPPALSMVVTVGAEELFGAEVEFQEE